MSRIEQKVSQLPNTEKARTKGATITLFHFFFLENWPEKGSETK